MAITQIVELEKALKTDPDNLEYLYDLGMNYYIVAAKDKSYTPKTISVWDTYIIKCPFKKAGFGYWNRALIKDFAGDKSGACADMEQAKKLLKKKEMDEGTAKHFEKVCGK